MTMRMRSLLMMLVHFSLRVEPQSTLTVIKHI